MLRGMSKKMRSCWAIALAVLYTACIFAPNLALALGSAGALPCFEGDHHAVAIAQSQDDSHHTTQHAHHGSAHTQDAGKVEKHEQPAPHQTGGKQKDGACCAFLCLTGVVTDCGFEAAHPVHALRLMSEIDPALLGRDPARIDRPPSTTLMSS